MLTSEVLDKAADIIQERGWITGVDVSPDESAWGSGAGSDKPLCLEGGIAAAMGLVFNTGDLVSDTQNYHDMLSCPAFRAVNAYLHPDIDVNTNSPKHRPYDYNDEPGRTAEEVIAVLRAAAAVERVREAGFVPLAELDSLETV